jgi:hypothetical protein
MAYFPYAASNSFFVVTIMLTFHLGKNMVQINATEKLLFDYTSC